MNDKRCVSCYVIEVSPHPCAMIAQPIPTWQS